MADQQRKTPEEFALEVLNTDSLRQATNLIARRDDAERDKWANVVAGFQLTHVNQIAVIEALEKRTVERNAIEGDRNLAIKRIATLTKERDEARRERDEAQEKLDAKTAVSLMDQLRMEQAAAARLDQVIYALGVGEDWWFDTYDSSVEIVGAPNGWAPTPEQWKTIADAGVRVAFITYQDGSAKAVSVHRPEPHECSPRKKHTERRALIDAALARAEAAEKERDCAKAEAQAFVVAWNEACAEGEELRAKLDRAAELLRQALVAHQDYNDCGGATASPEDCMWCTWVRALLAALRADAPESALAPSQDGAQPKSIAAGEVSSAAKVEPAQPKRMEFPEGGYGDEPVPEKCDTCWDSKKVCLLCLSPAHSDTLGGCRGGHDKPCPRCGTGRAKNREDDDEDQTTMAPAQATVGQAQATQAKDAQPSPADESEITREAWRHETVARPVEVLSEEMRQLWSKEACVNCGQLGYATRTEPRPKSELYFCGECEVVERYEQTNKELRRQLAEANTMRENQYKSIIALQSQLAELQKREEFKIHLKSGYITIYCHPEDFDKLVNALPPNVPYP